MSFGTLIAYNSEVDNEQCKMVQMEIIGNQAHFLSSFSLRMVFQHEGSTPVECKYIFPTNSKICIFGTKFILNGNEIPMELKLKEEAQKIFDEAKQQGRTSVLGTSLPNGLSEFLVGSLQPGSFCEVILECSFTCNLFDQKSLYLKFPLSVCTQSTLETSLDKFLSGIFSFQFHIESVQSLNLVKSNCGGKWDSLSSTFSLDTVPQSNSIILTTEFLEPIQSISVVNEDILFTTLCPQLPDTNISLSDFIFLIDCSGSMSGEKIQRAKECLEFFLRSLPIGSFFNIICFGSRFKSNYENLVQYNDDDTLKNSLSFCSKVDADFSGTDILGSLLPIFKILIQSHRVCQIFVISDG
jgi:hypothetical protein